VLTKGPIGFAIPAATTALFLLYEGELRGALWRFRVIPGLALSTAIAAPWFIAISIRQPDFIRFYFIGEHLQRFFEPRYSHGGRFYYYLPVLLGGSLPWTLVGIFIPWRSLQPNPARRFCLIAVATILVVFSAASAKLIPYILPAMPPLAVIVADGVVSLPSARRRIVTLGPLISIVGAGVICAAVFADRFASRNPATVQPELYAAGAVMLAAGAATFLFFLRGQFAGGLSAIAIASAAVLIIASYGRIRLESTRSYAQLGRALARRDGDSPLICYPRYIQSLPFYTQRRVILVGPKTELDYGSSHAADASQFFFSSGADLLRLWTSNPAPVLIVDRSALRPLERSLGPYRVLAADARKLAIVHAQPPTTRLGDR
jgi:4-amino-4-deoxy-L-arabinose transferase-like glycosyltransferase